MISTLLRKAVFPPFDVGRGFRAESLEYRGVTVRWTGVASCLLEFEGVRLAIDPFVSRPSLSDVFARRLQVDTAAIDRWIPHCDYVAVGHSHYDHVMDVPHIAKRDGALVVGAESTMTIARNAGVPGERLHTIEAAGGSVQCGPFRVTFIPSKHCAVIFGRIPYPGEVAADFVAPARASEYRMGGVFGVLVEVNGASFYHNGTADIDDEALHGHTADVALIGIAGAGRTERYFERLLGALRPEVIVPIHWDAFFDPMEQGIRLLPTIDFADFFARSKSFAKDARLHIPIWDPTKSLANTRT